MPLNTATFLMVGVAAPSAYPDHDATGRLPSGKWQVACGGEVCPENFPATPTVAVITLIDQPQTRK